MPNQWAKILPVAKINVGKFVPIRHGRPGEDGFYQSIWNLGECRRRGFNMDHLRHFPGSVVTHLIAAHAELLGPDECARLDAEHGMDGTEGER